MIKYTNLTCLTLAFVLSMMSAPVYASCALYLGSGDCKTNQKGQAVITNNNLGGGYTSRNTTTGEESYTGQTLNGGWRTRHQDGSSSYSRNNPFLNTDSNRPNNNNGSYWNNGR